MIKLATCATLLFLCSVAAQAQQMTLAGGTLVVQEGTRLSINGPVVWTLAPDAAVINNGEIDLGTEAVLSEAPGSPITGTGIERSERTYALPFLQAEPGGLGLTLSSATAIGNVEVVRGHQTIVLPSGDQSVARWYALDAAPLPGGELELVFDYDPSELNALDPSELSLFTAPASGSPWSLLASTPNAAMFNITGYDQSPWALYTAFDADAATLATFPPLPAPISAWPTVVEHVVHVQANGNERINTLELLDARGRLLLTEQPRTTLNGIVTLDLSTVASGPLFLRVNSVHVLKLMKP